MEDTALFENYCYVWSVKGEGFSSPLPTRPAAFRRGRRALFGGGGRAGADQRPSGAGDFAPGAAA